MKGRAEAPSKITADFIDRILLDLKEERPVRRKLPDGGRLYIDRPLPFICLYRNPAGSPDSVTGRLVTSEASFLIIPSGKHRKEIKALLRAVSEAMTEIFGSFMILEIWASEFSRNGEHSPDGTPGFRILAHPAHKVSPAVHELGRSLRKIRILKKQAEVEIVRTARVAPAGVTPLMTPAGAKSRKCHLVGLEVDPVYLSAQKELYPMVFKKLRRRISLAMKRSFHAFALMHTHDAPINFRALGRSMVTKTVWSIDRELAEIASSYDFLLMVTPVNMDSAWKKFRRRHFEKLPVFYYRPIPVDPSLMKRKLFSIGMDLIEDPTLAQLFGEKQLSVDRELTMLLDRGTSRFLYGSMQIFGGVSEDLLKTAKNILNTIPPRTREGTGRNFMKAEEFAELARDEISFYRESDREFDSGVFIRDDIYSGLMVSWGDLLISKSVKIPRGRANALIQHEIGTHALTYHNGRMQRFRQLSVGLPGYDELQEGLAVLSEYLVGGFSRSRLRLLAGRVAATHALVEGGSFIDTFRELNREYGFSQNTSFVITARVYRSGGLTKDAVYLRGLEHVIKYISSGNRLEPLFTGKIAARHIPIIRELQLRKILSPVPFLPRYLQDPGCTQRLEKLRNGMSIIKLAKGAMK